MCEFCTKHGEGKKWYLEARNYGEDLASDRRRQEFMRGFLANNGQQVASDNASVNLFQRVPMALRPLIGRLVSRKQKAIHFGQVVPIEDIEQILSITNSVVRLPCVCRRATQKKEARFCLGISVSSPFPGSFGPDVGSFEALEKAEALAFMRECETKGIFHSIWTFITPFIGGICNCDRLDCVATRATLNGIPVMFRAEYVAGIDWEHCSGCRACMRQCQFGAIGYSLSQNRCSIDRFRCFGCGVCRATCKEGAIELVERSAVPELRRVW
jgi:ferredoxin